MNLFWKISLILGLIALNGIFACAEMAVVSAHKVRLEQMAKRGSRAARAAVRLAENPNRFLSTVQVGITLIGVLSGALGGATLSQDVARWIALIPLLEPFAGAISMTLVVGAVTYLSLVIGELVPKRVALNNAEKLATLLALPMQALAVITSPLVKLLSFSTEMVLRLLRIKPNASSGVTQEEIEVLIEQGGQSGALEVVETELLDSVLRLDEWRVGVLMTARPQISWLDVNDSPDRVRDKVLHSAHSRFPVSEGTVDNLIGVVHAREILSQSLSDETLDLRKLVRAPIFVPESMSALRLLEIFKLEGTHVAMVIDEYGAVQGMITDNDILESIVGDLHGIEEPEEPDVIEREDGSYLLDGSLHIEKFKELFGIEELPDEGVAYQTIGGLLMYRTESIPISGQSIECEGLRLEVVDMDERRVDKVLATRIDQAQRQTDVDDNMI